VAPLFLSGNQIRYQTFWKGTGWGLGVPWKIKCIGSFFYLPFWHLHFPGQSQKYLLAPFQNEIVYTSRFCLHGMPLGGHISLYFLSFGTVVLAWSNYRAGRILAKEAWENLVRELGSIQGNRKGIPRTSKPPKPHLSSLRKWLPLRTYRQVSPMRFNSLELRHNFSESPAMKLIDDSKKERAKSPESTWWKKLISQTLSRSQEKSHQD